MWRKKKEKDYFQRKGARITGFQDWVLGTNITF